MPKAQLYSTQEAALPSGFHYASDGGGSWLDLKWYPSHARYAGYEPVSAELTTNWKSSAPIEDQDDPDPEWDTAVAAAESVLLVLLPPMLDAGMVAQDVARLIQQIEDNLANHFAS